MGWRRSELKSGTLNGIRAACRSAPSRGFLSHHREVIGTSTKFLECQTIHGSPPPPLVPPLYPSGREPKGREGKRREGNLVLRRRRREVSRIRHIQPQPMSASR